MISFTLRQVLLIAAVTLLAVLGWGVWEFQPARQLEKVFGRFVDAAQSRDWDTVAEFLADDYRDQWGQDRAAAIEAGRLLFGHFFVLDITREKVTHSAEKGNVVLAARLRFSGSGTAIAQAIIERANTLTEPTSFTWRQQSWKPWDWRLVAIAQPEVDG